MDGIPVHIENHFLNYDMNMVHIPVNSVNNVLDGDPFHCCAPKTHTQNSVGLALC